MFYGHINIGIKTISNNGGLPVHVMYIGLDAYDVFHLKISIGAYIIYGKDDQHLAYSDLSSAIAKYSSGAVLHLM